MLDEVGRKLYIAGTLWEVVPQLFRDLRTGLRRNYGEHPFRVGRFVRFGTWIGGDRDGNPFVTAEVTRQTLELLRGDALRRHLEACREMENRLSLSDRYHHGRNARRRGRAEAAAAVCPKSIEPWPAAIPASPIGSGSWRSGMRLEATAATDANAAGLRACAGLSQSRRNLPPTCNWSPTRSAKAATRSLADGLVQEWLDRIAVLGFHTAELDIREESGRLTSAVHELAAELGLCIDFRGLREDRKQAFLLAEPPREVVAPAHARNGSARRPARRSTCSACWPERSARYGTQSLGALIVSMTHHASDVLTMVWLSRLGAACEKVAARAAADHALVGDHRRPAACRRHSPRDVRAMPGYQAYLEALGRNQVCMIGYSDSVKDGGYIAANWQLYDAQQRLAAAGRASSTSRSPSFTAAAAPWAAAAVRRPRRSFRCRRLPSPDGCG